MLDLRSKKMIDSPWISWWQDDLPCEFGQKQTEENGQYLINILGESWLKKRIHRRDVHHPVIQRWINNGANSYLELNSLAEDIRLIDKKPHIETILNDIKSTNRCIATWHVIHCAAMFERGEKGIVSRFHPQTSCSSPDFSLTIEDNEYPVEAKLLTQSESEIEFGIYSDNLIAKIDNSVFVQDVIYPQITIIIKCFESLPDIGDVIKSLKESLNNYRGKSIKNAFNTFNIFIEPSIAVETDFSTHKSVYIFCPRNQKENIRMESRIKDASSQLKKYDLSISGIVCLGIGQHQDPYYIRERLVERFQNKQLKAVSIVILLRTGTYLQKPKRSILDLISIISNKNATQRVPNSSLKFQPLGIYGKLIDENHILNGISSYVKMIVEGKTVHSGASLYMPDIKYLTKEMLQ